MLKKVHATGMGLSFAVLLQTTPVFCAPKTCDSVTTELSSAASLPSHSIKYTDQSTQGWKTNWDRARMFFAKKKYALAQKQYEQLLQKKNNVELARWEFVNLLISIEKWERASTELAALLNAAPQRRDYQLAEAEILLGLGDAVAAEKRFADLYAYSCSTDAVRVLQGYITSLEKQKKTRQIIPLFEKLIKLTPEDLSLQKKYAEILYQTHQLNKAIFVLLQLTKKYPRDIDLLSKLAELYTARANKEQAAICWQQLIGIAPNNLKANRELVAYYKEAANASMQLRHTERLFSLQPYNFTLLRQIADLQRNIHRPDLALESYNRLAAYFPTDSSILAEREKTVDEVADQLLTLLHNNGSGKLWTTLVRSPKDKKVVYKTMADILRVNGAQDALLEVLLVLSQEEQENLSISQEIHLLQKQQAKHKILAASQKVKTREQSIISQ
jgi:tetratricopeptide (TPR) repeat protein